MHKPTRHRRLVAALICTAATAVAGPFAAARAQGSGPPAAAAHPAPAAPVVRPAPPAPPLPATATPPVTSAPSSSSSSAAPPPSRPAAAAATATAAHYDPYRCHPAEDIACTVVRETPKGMVIVTLRPPRASAQPAAWSVIAGTPPGTAATQPGGTIYVVPTMRGTDPGGAGPIFTATANGAPILD